MKKLFLVLSILSCAAFGIASAQAFNPQPDPPGDYYGD